MSYQYWPATQGRGEFVRLTLVKASTVSSPDAAPGAV